MVVTFVVPPWVVVRQVSEVYVQKEEVNGSKARVLDHCNQCCTLVSRVPSDMTACIGPRVNDHGCLEQFVRPWAAHPVTQRLMAGGTLYLPAAEGFQSKAATMSRRST